MWQISLFCYFFYYLFHIKYYEMPTWVYHPSSCCWHTIKIPKVEAILLESLTHWGGVTHIPVCVSDLTIIGSYNGLSPGRRQAIIRTNAGILLKRPLGTNFSEILMEILLFSIKKMRLKVSTPKRRPFCLGLNVLKCWASCTRLPLDIHT